MGPKGGDREAAAGPGEHVGRDAGGLGKAVRDPNTTPTPASAGQTRTGCVENHLLPLSSPGAKARRLARLPSGGGRGCVDPVMCADWRNGDGVWARRLLPRTCRGRKLCGKKGGGNQGPEGPGAERRWESGWRLIPVLA